MARLVIFGTGSFAQLARFYFDRDSPHEVVAFTAHRAGLPPGGEFEDLPAVAFEDVAAVYPPDSHAMFVAVGYRDVNRVRERVCGEAIAAGYELTSFVSSRATYYDTPIGRNCFVFEDNTIQPYTAIGDGVVLWSGNHVGHHATIGDWCFITSHVVISGHTTIGSHCFIGVNATLRDAITIGRANVIGAGAVIMRSTGDEEVYVPQRTRVSERSSRDLGM